MPPLLAPLATHFPVRISRSLSRMACWSAAAWAMFRKLQSVADGTALGK